MKKIKFAILVTIIIAITAMATYFWIDHRPSEMRPTVIQDNKVEVEIDQGVKTEIPKPNSGLITIAAGQKIEVETSVKEMPSVQIPVASPEGKEGYTPKTPQKASVTRETDKHGNTTITVQTPVTPVYSPEKEDVSYNVPTVPEQITDDSIEISPENQQLPDNNWIVTETKVYIARYHSRVKDIFLLSFDGDKEWGKAIEVLRLKSKPSWMSEWLYEPLEWSSVDLIITPRFEPLGIERVGVGVSKEVYCSELVILDIGVAGTYQISTKEFELAGYLSIDF